MATFEGKGVSYSSLSTMDNKGNKKFQFGEEDDEDGGLNDFWNIGYEEERKNSSPLSTTSSAAKKNYEYEYADDEPAEKDVEEEEDFVDTGYDNAKDDRYRYNSLQMQKIQPEVNLKNVLGGIVAIITGQNKVQSDKNIGDGFVEVGDQSDSSSPIKYPIVKDICDSVYQNVFSPSAPPLLNPLAACKEMLDAEPPEWVPDSAATKCMKCDCPFTALTRGRHHCRFCGGIFCRACSKGRCLLPIKFRERSPQRVCDTCFEKLEPLQIFWVNTISNASQIAKHDVTDWTCTRGWLNMPIGLSMEYDIYKSCNTLKSYCQAARLKPERSMPSAVLRGAKGLAILTVAKAGMLLTYKIGTGLVVARRVDGSWSAPSAIASVGLGWGVQAGGELTDFIIVLHDHKAVNAFCSRMHFALGAGCSAAAGPVGRVLEADLRAGDRGSGMCYTYSCSKGAFLGVSLEGNIITTRMDTNLEFYGDPYLTTTDILHGTVERPRAAEPLYSALDNLFSKLW
ncbi:hypothetical protein C5167_028991 [Papaver somniferum]|uniref:uncharacterized protein LOC113337239 n=1 Tax=Papaver somniferum TaxID=3469 RepID=UPI000E703713|nr:uncharacterized protein LOC113337239 [Papaver somniferum]RZC89925.1 hypothetical protein C5167_028991 [Papaver somniferum]